MINTQIFLLVSIYAILSTVIRIFLGNKIKKILIAENIKVPKYTFNAAPGFGGEYRYCKELIKNGLHKKSPMITTIYFVIFYSYVILFILILYWGINNMS